MAHVVHCTFWAHPEDLARNSSSSHSVLLCRSLLLRSPFLLLPPLPYPFLFPANYGSYPNGFPHMGSFHYFFSGSCSRCTGRETLIINSTFGLFIFIKHFLLSFQSFLIFITSREYTRISYFQFVISVSTLFFFFVNI